MRPDPDRQPDGITTRPLRPTFTSTAPDTRSNHALLKAGTAHLHQRVEDAFAGCDLQTRRGLAAFLGAQACAVFALEAALDHASLLAVCPDWPARRRSAALLRDLAELGVAPPKPLPIPAFDTIDARLGALYVLEGSRLGGRVLARHVRQSADPRVREAVRFLQHEPAAGDWASVRALLNRPDYDAGRLLAGATAAFGCFFDAARSLTKVSEAEQGIAAG